MGSIEIQSLTDYRAALEGAAFFPQLTAGLVILGDQDRLDFVQRQTTNDLSLLTTSRSVMTVLTSPTARILDVLRLVHQGEDIYALTLPGHGSDTHQYLQRRIFFNDKVRLEDVSSDFNQIDLEGPGAQDTLNYLSIDQKLELDGVVRADYDNALLIAIGQRGYAGLGVRLIVPASSAEIIKSALLQSGAERLSTETSEILRVEAGLPGPGAELSEDYTPLEVSMEHTISGTKGCYPGQEVIARQITYDKVTRKLVGLRLDAPMQQGSRLSVDGSPAGEITSAVISPRFGPIALGVLKRPHHELGTILDVQMEEQSAPVRAEVVGLPFQA